MEPVEDTEENQEICQKYCGACPTYKCNFLAQNQPDILFNAPGISTALVFHSRLFLAGFAFRKRGFR